MDRCAIRWFGGCFLLWSWALALDVIHVRPRRLRTRCVTVDRQNNDVTNFFIQFIFVYNFGCLAMCVAHALCGPAIVFFARKFMFFFIALTFACRAVCLTIFVSELMCKRHHTLHMLHIHIHWSMPCASAFGFFYFFSGICCDWIWTTRANHIICLNISENFVTLSCGRPFIWCEIRLGSVSVCVCWTWITNIVDNNVNIQKGRVPSVYIAVGLFWVINFLCVRNHIDG